MSYCVTLWNNVSKVISLVLTKSTFYYILLPCCGKELLCLQIVLLLWKYHMVSGYYMMFNCDQKVLGLHRIKKKKKKHQTARDTFDFYPAWSRVTVASCRHHQELPRGITCSCIFLRLLSTHCNDRRHEAFPSSNQLRCATLLRVTSSASFSILTFYLLKLHYSSLFFSC